MSSSQQECKGGRGLKVHVGMLAFPTASSAWIKPLPAKESHTCCALESTSVATACLQKTNCMQLPCGPNHRWRGLAAVFIEKVHARVAEFSTSNSSQASPAVVGTTGKPHAVLCVGNHHVLWPRQGMQMQQNTPPSNPATDSNIRQYVLSSPLRA